jgi:hypothetical protein
MPLADVNLRGPYIPGVQTPYIQQPHIPQPYVQLPGGMGSVAGPRVNTPMIPQPRIPQPTTPSANFQLKGPSNNTILLIIFVLVALLIGVGALVLLKK